MGLLDTLLGRTKPVRANLDALFTLPSAAITLQSASGVVPSGRAGVCWKPPAGQGAADIQKEITELLGIGDEPAGPVLDPKLPTVGPSVAPDGEDRGGGTGEGVSSDALAAQGGAAPGGALRQAEDRFGYRWLLLEDADVEDLVTRVHMINSTLTDAGWGPQLLCSVFQMVPGPDADMDTHPFFLVYLYKRGTFYPFAPTGGERRDTELELRIRAVVGSDLPIEQDLSRWFPLWDLPVG